MCGDHLTAFEDPMYANTPEGEELRRLAAEAVEARWTRRIELEDWS